MPTIKQRIKKTIAYTLITAQLLLPNFVKAQNTTVITSEISYNGPLTLKIKPSYNKKEEKEKSQLELLVGKTIKKESLKTGIYADAKSDLEQTAWVGIRGEGDYKIKNFHIGLQLRYFFGLNKKSENHFYYIPYIMQNLTKKLRIGVWDYAKQDYKNKKGFSYLGPLVVYSFNKNIGILMHYGKDIKNKGNLTYLKLNLKF